MSNKTVIPRRDYENFIELMPICCVDLVIRCQRKILLVCRNNEPAKDKWWVPGGRLLKNELLDDCALRKAKEETGLDVRIVKRLQTYEFFDSAANFDYVTSGTHAIVVGYLVEPTSNTARVTICNQSNDHRWVQSTTGLNLDPYILSLLSDI